MNRRRRRSRRKKERQKSFGEIIEKNTFVAQGETDKPQCSWVSLQQWDTRRTDSWVCCWATGRRSFWKHVSQSKKKLFLMLFNGTIINHPSLKSLFPFSYGGLEMTHRAKVTTRAETRQTRPVNSFTFFFFFWFCNRWNMNFKKCHLQFKHWGFFLLLFLWDFETYLIHSLHPASCQKRG